MQALPLLTLAPSSLNFRRLVLTKVAIENFRSCSRVELDSVAGLIALTGKNGAGKTNILRAIKWAAESASSQSSISLRHDTGRLGRTRVALDLQFGSRKVRYTIDAELQTREGERGTELSLGELVVDITGHEAVLLERTGNVVKFSGDTFGLEKQIPAMRAAVTLRPESEASTVIRQMLAFLEGIHYYPLDEPADLDGQGIVDVSDYIAWSAGEKRKLNPRAQVLYRLMALGHDRPESLRELTELLGPTGLGLIHQLSLFSITFDPTSKIDSSGAWGPDIRLEQSETTKSYVACSFQVPSSDGWFNFSDLSTGTRRLIRLFTMLLHDDATVLLIEQPEDAIHAGLLHKVIPQLRAYSGTRQFIVTSHSADVFNALKPAELRIVELDDGVTTARELSASEVDAACEYMRREGTFADFVKVVSQN